MREGRNGSNRNCVGKKQVKQDFRERERKREII